MNNDKVILWLDDYRDPFINHEGRVPKEQGVIHWVKNYSEFLEWITTHKLPDIISFDHDLADEHYVPNEYWESEESSRKYQEAQSYKEKTGLECAKWLCWYCEEYNLELPSCYVHSANPIGAQNIRSYLLNFSKHRERNKL